jgi:hypothetical protein
LGHGNKVFEGHGCGNGLRDKCLGKRVEEQAINVNTKVEEKGFRDKCLGTRFEEQAISCNIKRQGMMNKGLVTIVEGKGLRNKGLMTTL